MSTEPLRAGGFRERTFRSQDDVSIYFRDYGDPAAAGVPVLCLSGLTRNSKDFHEIALRLAGRHRVLCMDYRGRGKSGYDPDWRNYHPRTYVADALQLLIVAGVHRAAVVGTSLGGLCAMGLGAAAPTVLAGVVLNDVGPVIAETGRTRIAGYIGRDVRMPDLDAAAAAMAIQYANAYPGASADHWRTLADGTFTADAATGGLRLDYDLKIADALAEQGKEPIADLWPLYLSLASLPVLLVRGELSDILDESTFRRMQELHPGARALIAPNRGHVPLPHEEPFASTLIEFLSRI